MIHDENEKMNVLCEVNTKKSEKYLVDILDFFRGTGKDIAFC